MLGGVFLGVKAYEWNEKFEEHHVPGAVVPPRRHPPASRATAQLFFSLYFAMTGLHALHMVIGAGLLLVPDSAGAQRAVHRRRTIRRSTWSGLYWHFVDIIWIFLFPLLYLIDRHLRS